MSLNRRQPGLGWIIRLLVPTSHRDTILGDLHELDHRLRRAGAGPLSRRRHLARELIDIGLRAPRWRFESWIAARRARMRTAPASAPVRVSSRPKENWMSSLVSDLRFAFRQLRRTPGFAAVSLLVLGLGLGANLTIFSLANAVLLRPPAGIDSTDGLVRLLSRSQQTRDFEDSLSYPDFVDFSTLLEGKAQIAAYDHTPMSVRVGDQTSRVRGALVDGPYFELFGVEAERGRLLVPTDHLDQSSGGVVVLSHSFWRERFGAAETAVGDSMSINGTLYEIVGVAGKPFRGVEPFDRADLWVPMVMQPLARPHRVGLLDSRESTWMRVVGALERGVRPSDLRPALTSMTRKVSNDPEDTRLREFDVIAGLGPGPSDRRAATMMMSGLLLLVSLVLIIACANVANLVLARTQRRSSEIAVRRALGAGRRRLIRQLLTENLTLSMLAAAVGLVLAMILRGSLVALLPDIASSNLELKVDRNVVLYALLLAGLSGMVFGLAPLLSRSGRSAIGVGARSTGQRHGGRLRATLVVGQLALSVVLLMSAGLLLETLRRLQEVPAGFDRSQVATAALDLGIQNYEPDRAARFHLDLLDRLNGRPGLERVATATTLPLSGASDSWGGLEVEGHDAPAGRPGWQAQVNVVSPGYFETLRIPVLRGRDFGAQDGPSARPAVIVNEAFRQRFWPEGALDRTIRRGSADGDVFHVVGVVGDVHYSSLSEPVRPMIYLPYAQRVEPRFSLLARSAADSTAQIATDAVRGAVQTIDPDLPIFAVAPLDEIVEQSLWQQRLVGSLLTLFGGLALLLAAVGLYGVVACLVAERRREIGIRLAVGADPGEVVRLFVGGSLRLATLAIALGLVGSLATGRLLSNVLYGVSPLPPLTVAAVCALLLIASLVAALGPATLASRLDPSRVLRES